MTQIGDNPVSVSAITSRPQTQGDTRRALRIFYAGGSGNVIGTFEKWSQGREEDTILSIAYSSQFFDLCQKMGAVAYVTSAYGDGRRVDAPRFTLRHLAVPLLEAGGLSYYLGQLVYAMRLTARVLWFRADVLVLSTNVLHFLFWPLRWFGVAIVPSLHNGFWPAGRQPRGRVKRLVQRLNGAFWHRCVAATLSISPECIRQLRTFAPRLRGEVIHVRPQYRRQCLDLTAPPPLSRRPFRVLFAGRIEGNKGVFDLLQIADRLHRKDPGGYEWELCGSGGALEELRQKVQQRGLEGVVHTPGWLSRPQMAQAMGRCHVVVVPTRSELAEAFNKVAVESVLAGRPVITSSATPALDLVAQAAVEVKPDDLDDYQRAVENLRDDPSLYDAKRRACGELQPQFYNRDFSWGAALERVLTPLAQRKGRRWRPVESQP